MRIEGPIIVVDDDTDDHYLMTRVFERLTVTAEIKFFSEGRKALEYLKSTKDRPFIIMCDVNMPVMSGLELRKRINEEKVLRDKNIPFIFFSTAAMGSLVNEAYAMTIQGFFIKEQTLDRLESTVKTILEYWSKCIYPSPKIVSEYHH